MELATHGVHVSAVPTLKTDAEMDALGCPDFIGMNDL